MIPLTPAQHRLWFIERAGGDGDYRTSAVHRLTGPFDEGALLAALRLVLSRHDALRMSITERDGVPGQTVTSAVSPVLEVVEAQDEAHGLALAEAAVRRSIALDAPPLLRVTVVKVTPTMQLVALLTHHIVCDGPSLAVVTDELYTAYRTPGVVLGPVGLSFASYALAQRAVGEGDREYWRDRLADVPAPAQLSGDRSLAPALPSGDHSLAPALSSGDRGIVAARVGARHPLPITPELGRAVRELARRSRCTPFMVLLTALKVLLLRHTGQEDIVVGSPVADRADERLERTVGMFVNTLALRTDLSGSPTLTEALSRIRAGTAADLARARHPFDQVVAEVRPGPLFQVMIAFAADGEDAGGAEWVPVAPPAWFDLTMVVFAGRSLDVSFDYAANVFSPETIQRYGEQVVAILTAMTTEPDADVWEVPLLTAAERLTITTGGASAAVPPVHRLFEARAAETPDALAVLDGVSGPAGAVSGVTGEAASPDGVSSASPAPRGASSGAGAAVALGGRDTLTYRQLDRRANHVAARLVALGLCPGSRVAVLLPTSADAVIAILGVLKAGCAYIPLDPSHPPERLATMLAVASAVVTGATPLSSVAVEPLVTGSAPAGPAVVEVSAVGTALVGPPAVEAVATGSALAGPPVVELDGGVADRPPLVETGPDDPAYVIYTSGSTGVPKGVVVTHRSLSALTESFREAHTCFAAGNRVLMLPPLTFDASVGDVFPALTGGAALVLHREPAALTGQELVAFCTTHGVTAVDTASALWQKWTADLAGTLVPPDWPVTEVMVGGESVPMATLRLWARITRERVTFYQHYGPTEATVCATVQRTVDGRECGEPANLPIGRPLPHVRAYVLDGRGGLAPVGAWGELCLAGDCLAQGYLGDAEFTERRFVRDPFGDGRMYLTGDVARYRPDGALEFLGRTDRQLKIRGHRIEPAEVEAAVAAYPGVGEVAVVQHDHRLVAYLIRAQPAERPGPRDGDPGADRLASRDGGSRRDRLAPRDGGLPADGVASGDGGLRAAGDADLRAFVRARLPEVMVPAVFVEVERLPLTSHAKIDYAALPAPDQPRPEHEPPRGAVEERLAGIWAEVLGVPRVGRRDGFFELGGHSLLAAPVVARIRRDLGVDLSLRAILETADLADLALAVTEGAPREEALDLMAQAVLPPDLCGLLVVAGGEPAAGRPDAEPRVGGGADAGRSDVGVQGRPRRGRGRVLLTGATGFLGAYLLKGLLERGQHRVVCLVRAETPQAATKRVCDNLGRYGLWHPDYAQRIEGLPGDLAEHRFGLGDQRFAALAHDLERICHNGSLVSFAQPYEKLRPANVGGTLEVLRLAALAQKIPVHVVSTLGVFLGDAWRGRTVTEGDQPDDPDGLHGGYNHSKWAADRIVRLARERGLPVSVHRPARVSGDSRTGVGVPGDHFSRMLATFVQTGMVPNLPHTEDLAPVDYVGAAIAHLALSEEHGRDFHYFNNATLTYPGIADALGLELVPWVRWRTAVLAGGSRMAIAPFADALTEQPPVAERPLFDCRATERAAGIVCPPADAELLARYLKGGAVNPEQEGRA